jgi:MFS family permease
MTVNMKIDLVGKERRGLALGLNEFAGYLSVAVVGFVTGYLAATYGLKPYPFFIGIAFVLVGFIISWLVVKDTRKFTLLEIKENQEELTRKITTENNDHPHISSTAANEKKSFGNLTFIQVFLETSWKNRSLLSLSQAGLVNNLIFGVSWGLFTLYFASFSISDRHT